MWRQSLLVLNLTILLTNVTCQINNTNQETVSSMEVQTFIETGEEETQASVNATLTFFLVPDNETNEHFLVPDNEMNERFLDADHDHGNVSYSNETFPGPVILEPFVVEWEEIPEVFLPPVETIFMFEYIYQTHMWDKALYTPGQYQLSLCGKVCLGEETVYVKPFECPTIECYDCICDRPRCEVYDICCPDDPNGYVFPHLLKETELEYPVDDGESVPDLDLQVPTGDQEFPTPAPPEPPEPHFRINHNKAAMVKCSNDRWGRYLYIQSCPLNYEDSQTRQLCDEDSVSNGETTLDMFARVTDNITGIIYRNIFCALCNEVVEHIQWEVEIECTSYMFVYGATTIEELLNFSLKPGSKCDILQSPPSNSNTEPVPCYNDWIYTEAVDRCNVSGLWLEYDQDVERACHNMEGRSYRVKHVRYSFSDGPTWMFKNVFCAICNMRNYPHYGNCYNPGTEDIIDRTEPQIRIFSFLLGFGSRRRSFSPMFESTFTFSSCTEEQWSAPDGSCMDVHCSPGKQLEGNSCVTALDQIRGLSYNIQLWFLPSTTLVGGDVDIPQTFTHSMVLGGLFTQIIHPLFEVISDMTVDFGFIVPNATQDGRESSRFIPPIALWVTALVDAQALFSRDWFESHLVTSFTGASVGFNFSDHTTEYQAVPFPGSPPVASDVCSKPDVQCHNEQNTFGYFFASAPDPSHSIIPNKILNCPFIMFNKTMFEIVFYQDTKSLLPHTIVTLTIGDATLNFSQNSELSFIDTRENGSLRVCREALDLKLKNLEEEQRRNFYANLFMSKADEATKAQYYMTLGFVSVSMFCLLLILFTYFRFRSLRSAAGMNNIFLCTSLLLAQAALFTSVHLSGPRTLCTVVGMLTHFLWLWMFVWSFICCFHMFRVFTAKTRNSCPHRAQTTRFVWTVVLSVTAPAMVVGIVVSSSYFTSGGSRIGYGHNSCYLDSSLLIGLATVLPLCLVSVANVVFFATTVATIHKIRKLQSHDAVRKEDRRNLYIYMKLSTMTGAFWLIQIVAEAADIDTLRFLAIILNGSQGTFIFFSYIWNKRVLNLYLHSLGFKPVTLTSSGTQRKTVMSTLGALASDARKAEERNRPSMVSSEGTLNQDSEVGLERRVSADSDQNVQRKSSQSSSQSSGVHSGRDGCFNDACDPLDVQVLEINYAQLIRRNAYVDAQPIEANHDVDAQPIEANHDVDAQPIEANHDVDAQPIEANHEGDTQSFERNHEGDTQSFERNHNVDAQPFGVNHGVDDQPFEINS